jgi:hypothetical protein
LDLIEKWLVKNLEGSMMGNEDINLSINGIAPYQSFHGLNELKIVSEFIYILAVILLHCTVLCFMLYKNVAQAEGNFFIIQL